jgi:BMFP domain-containing protein YqiC
MQSQNKFFDDLAKVVNGAAGTVAGMAREAESGARERAREWIGGLDLVSREEFEVQKDLLAAARTEIDALKARIDAMAGPAAADVSLTKRPRKPKG